jgi:hypothetical protein
MRQTRFLQLSIPAMFLAASMTMQAAPNPTFPPMAAADLIKREIYLPSGLQGKWNLLLIAFVRAQQKGH